MTLSSHKAGFVSLVGKPNAGKSTLMNTLVGEKLSIITAKAQTTRHRICGILSGDNFQIVYSDTPGMIKPAYALQASMMRAVRSSLVDADVLLWVVDVHDQDLPDDWAAQLQERTLPVLLLINKVDLVEEAALAKVLQYWSDRVQVEAIIPVSALQSYNIDRVFEQVLEGLPEHPPYYPKDMLTDKPERFFATEIIREKILRNYHQEIPYSVEVVIDTFKEEKGLVKISATIHVERQSQKSILIGKQGSALKKVGTEARRDLEQFLGKKVFLEQHVKVMPSWRTHPQLLQRLGYV
ncbi:MAG: GTPase Era [Bacteroidota bacterium]